MRNNTKKKNITIQITIMTSLIVMEIIAFVGHQGPLALEQETNDTRVTNQWPNIMSNVKTFVVSNVFSPKIVDSAFIHPFAVVIGDCFIGEDVLMAPTAVCKAEEGVPIHVGDYSNVQDGVILHAIDAVKNGVNNQGIHYYYTLNRNDGLTHFDFTCTSIPRHPLLNSSIRII